jgi:hypothetical protein
MAQANTLSVLRMRVEDLKRFKVSINPEARRLLNWEANIKFNASEGSVGKPAQLAAKIRWAALLQSTDVDSTTLSVF